MKRALSLRRNNKSEIPDTIKNEFLKYGGEAIAILLRDYFQQILQSADIPTQWNSSTLINKTKAAKIKESLIIKGGISLTSNIAKLFEKIIISRLNNHLILQSASRIPTRKKHTNQFVSSENIRDSVIQQRMTQNQETYVAFIDLEKTFGKVWNSAIFYLSWIRGIRGKLWWIMHKLNNNQETTVMVTFGLTDRSQTRNLDYW